MKKILILILFCFSLCTFAAYQYEVSNTGINITGNTGLILQFTDNSFFKNYDQLGILVDGKETLFNTSDVKGKKFDIGQYLTGNQIGLFVVQDGIKYDGFNFVDHNNGHYLFTIPNNTTFDFKINAYTYSGDTQPSGQPLPGVLATLVIGGVTIGVRYVVKRKKA